MGRIDRYVVRQLMTAFGFAALILVLVYWINRAVVLFDRLLADGQSAGVFLEFTALALPAIVKTVLPIAAFAATLWAVARMVGDSEITVARAAGLSPWRLARPVLAFGCVAALLVSVLAHGLVPASAGRLAARSADIAETATAGLVREGEFVSPIAGLTLYVREVSPEGELRDLLLSDSRATDRSVTYTAARAYLVAGDAGPQLVMIDGLVQRVALPPNGNGERRMIATAFADLVYDLGPLMGMGRPDRRGSRELSTPELLSPTPALEEETRKSAGLLFAEAQDRFAEALMAPVAALIAFAALMAAPYGRLGAWRQVVAAIVLVVLVKVVESLAFQAVRDDPRMWPLSYLPALIGLAIGTGLLWLAGRPRPVCAPASGRVAEAAAGTATGAAA